MPYARIHHGGHLAAIAKRTVVLAAALAVAMSVLVGSARPAGATTSLLSLRSSVVHLTNVARAAKGCRPLKVSVRLTNAAQGHATDMSRKHYFSHTSLDGTSWITRIRRAGWTTPGGENIAYGFLSPTGVLKAWMNSPGHRRNLLDCHFHYIGVGYASGGHYWDQDFGY